MSQILKSFGTQTYQIIYPVAQEHDGLRLDQFVLKYFSTFSREIIKRKIEKGEVKIPGRPFPHKPSAKVYHGESVQIVTHKEGLEDEFWRGQKLRLDSPSIIFEDEDLLVINKPPYMSTHPAGKHLFNCATVYYEALYGHTIHSIHRLDRETSGVLLLGKNPGATQKITSMFEDGMVKKCYFFIAHKNSNHTPFPFKATENMGTKDNFLPRNYVHCFTDPALGKEAQTHFELLEEYDDYVVAMAFPQTGRQHQIRAHAAYHGYPLLGDKMYNGDPTVFMRFKDEVATSEDHQKMQIPRHALHAVGLSLKNHSTYKEPFRAAIPNDLADWLEQKLYLNIEELEAKIQAKINAFFFH